MPGWDREAANPQHFTSELLADVKFADVKASSVTTWITWVHHRVINTEFSRKRGRMSIAERESF